LRLLRVAPQGRVFPALAKKLEMPGKLRTLHEKLIDFSSIMVNILRGMLEDFFQKQARVAYHSHHPATCHKEL